MTSEMTLVFGLLAATIVLFVSDRLRLDLVALLALLALLLTGILTPAEALAGFSDPVVLIIAGLFVVGGALEQTGVANALGRGIGKVAGGNPLTLLIVVMGVAAFLSAFMSSTGTTAVLLPVVVSLARDARISPSRLLIPLAFASLLGGMLTLIGTPPNIVVSNQLQVGGLAPFGFFTFTPVGLMVLAIGIGFMVLAGRHLLPDHSHAAPPAASPNESLSIPELAEAYQIAGNLFRLRIRRSSPLLGRTLAEAQLRKQYEVNVLEIQPRQDMHSMPEPARPVRADTVLNAFDILHAQGRPEAVRRLAREQDFAITAGEHYNSQLISQELGMAEVLLTPRSRLIGHTLREVRFHDRYNVTVLAIKRLGRPLAGDLADITLDFGDTLLVEGTWDRIGLLDQERQHFIVVGQPREMTERQQTPRRARLAVVIMLAMLVLMTLEIVPIVTAVLLAAVAMTLTGCLTMDDAYRNINWQSVVLIAGMLPMATALQKTGGIQFIADWLSGGFGSTGPLAIMAGLFILTSFFSQFISNTATAVLVAPIAFQAAMDMGVQPQAFLMTVAVAASTSFATPVASPVNTLVLGPGGYRFADFAKLGLSLQILIMAAVLIGLPFLFPF